MKVLAIVGDQVLPAFNLAGMEIISPATHDELLLVFSEAVQQKDLALLVISARYAMALKQEIQDVRLSKNPIVILEISSSRGNYYAGELLMQQIKQTIGQ